MSWREIYDTDAQGLWALIVVPAAFLVWRLVRARWSPPETEAARFVRAWSLAFAIQTILDPLVTGPLLRALGAGDGALGQAVLFLFVWLGDFRVLFVVLGVAEPERAWSVVAAEAAAWSFAVPAATFVTLAALHATVGALPGVALWIVYEAAFTALALAWRRWLVPARTPTARPAVRAFLRGILAYAATYYALWEIADLLVLAGVDAGWALRIVPNQLYYAFFVPFVALTFERYVSMSASAQAAR